MAEIRENNPDESSPLPERCLQQFEISSNTSSSTAEEKLEDLPSMVAGVCSNNFNLQQEATTLFSKFISRERCRLIEEVILSRVVPRFVEFLTRTDSPQLQFDAAFILTNLCSRFESAKLVIDKGGIPIFVELLNYPNEHVRVQTLWALGTIAGFSLSFRDLVLSHGALIPLLERLNEHDNIPMKRTVAMVLLNLCKGKPQPPFEQRKLALQSLRRLVHSKDKEALRHTCWALSCLSHGPNEQIQTVIEADICPRLIELLLHPSPLVLTAVLSTVGNITLGGDDKIQHLIDNGTLPCLLRLLSHNHSNSIKQQVCWIIRNITAANREQTRAAIDVGLILPLVKLLPTAELRTKKLAARAVSNAIVDATTEEISCWIKSGCIRPLCDLLVCSETDPKLVTAYLMALEEILSVGEVSGKAGEVNYNARLIEEAGGFGKIEDLRNHENTEISDIAIHILERDWLEEGGGG